MTNNEQTMAVEQMFQEMLEIKQSGKTLTFDENLLLLEKYKEMYKDEMEAVRIEICAEKSTSEANKYAEGYKEGYHRAIENAKYQINKWIDKELKITQP